MDADIIVVGAGLSGLTAARDMEAAGHHVLVLDKSRSSGGRLATRRIQDGVADHGAQFFTVRTEAFQRQVADWLGRDLVKVWSMGWSDGSLRRTPRDGHPRYMVQGGMNRLAKDLETQIRQLRLHTTVEFINWDERQWHVMTSDGQTLTCGGLILTPPVPQSLAMLVDVPLTDDDREDLEHIEYGPCLCGLFLVDGDFSLPEPGAIQNFSQPLYWIADNMRKGISPRRVITAHVGTTASRQRFDDPDGQTLDWMREQISPRLGEDARIIEQQLKRWRYSIPLTTHPDDTLLAEGLPLAFAGDAFGGRGRIEGAYLSGLAAGQALSAYLQR